MLAYEGSDGTFDGYGVTRCPVGRLPMLARSDRAGLRRRCMAATTWPPAYLPTFSPIEECWSKVKAFVRGRSPHILMELNAAPGNAFVAVTLEDIDGWLRRCGH